MRVPNNTLIHIISDSKYVIEGMTKHASKWEDVGWTDVKNAEALCDLLARLRGRSARTTFEWVKGHTGNVGNEQADRLAKMGRTT